MQLRYICNFWVRLNFICWMVSIFWYCSSHRIFKRHERSSDSDIGRDDFFHFCFQKDFKICSGSNSLLLFEFWFFYLNFLLKESKVDDKTAKVKKSEKTWLTSIFENAILFADVPAENKSFKAIIFLRVTECTEDSYIGILIFFLFFLQGKRLKLLL